MEDHKSRVRVAALGIATVLAAAALAGCTGNFNVKQTEPLRVHLEGDNSGGPSSSGSVTVHVDTQSQPQQRVVVETTNDTSTVTVAATVRAGPSTTGNTTTNTTSTIIKIIVQSNGETLGQQQVQADSGATKDVTLNVNVKGKSNVVIIMEAVQGTADVVVTAKGN